MLNKSQDEIIALWKSSDFPLVSIRCITYNHASYIAQCLEGFLSQETNFPFEIVVHDDASTDDTANIVKKYESEYPKIIKGIYETENQYSKHDDSIDRIMNAYMRGKYIALCEGDDYWCYPHKLQEQVDFLECNSDYSACTHNTLLLNMKKNKELVRYSTEDADLGLEDILERNGWHTSSLVCKSDFLINRPSFCFAQKDVGDFPLSVYLGIRGKVKRFGKVMSVYRFCVPGSWQSRIGQNRMKCMDNYSGQIKMLNMANDYSEGKYEKLFKNAIKRVSYKKLKLLRDVEKMRSAEFREFWNKEPMLKKIYYGLRNFLDKTSTK